MTPEGAPMRMKDETLERIRGDALAPDNLLSEQSIRWRDVVAECVTEIDRLRAAVRAPVDEEVVRAIELVLMCRLKPSEAQTVARVLERLSASYSAACGERDAETFRADEIAESRRIIVANHRDAMLRAEAAESALSLALVERDRAREALVEGRRLVNLWAVGSAADVDETTGEVSFGWFVCNECMAEYHSRDGLVHEPGCTVVKFLNQSGDALKSPAPIPEQETE